MNIFQSLFYLNFFWHLPVLIIPSSKLISSFEFHDIVVFWISFSSCDIFFRAPFTWSVIKFGFLQGYWSSSLYSLPGFCHPFLSLKLSFKNKQPSICIFCWGPSSSVNKPRAEQCGSPFSTPTTPLFSSLSALVLCHYHSPQSRKLWGTWCFLGSLTVSTQVVTHVRSQSCFLCIVSSVLVSVQGLFISTSAIKVGCCVIFLISDVPLHFPPILLAEWPFQISNLTMSFPRWVPSVTSWCLEEEIEAQLSSFLASS